MAVSFDIQSSGNRVVLQGSRNATAADTIQTLSTVFGHSDYQPGMALVWDFRDMGRTWTADEIRQLIGYLAEHVEDRGAGKEAVIVSREVDFGLARMAQAFSRDLPRPLRVFRDMTEAEAWLAET